MDATAPLPHGKNLRKGRVSIARQIYLVTIVTANRLPVFASLKNARIAVKIFHDNDIVRNAQTLAFVVMPDHLHWLIQMTDEGDLPKLIRLYKTKVSLQLQQRIWQRGFHDHALRAEEDIRDLARYIVANPLRAGLVEHIGEYPHWDAIWL
jgi:putative transposase